MHNPVLQISFIHTRRPRIRHPRVLGAIFAACALLFLCLPPAARAQSEPGQSSSRTPPTPSVPGVSPNSSDNGDPSLRHMNEAMALKRNTMRQQQIVTDSAHLLDLAQKLNDEVSKSNKDQLSIAVVKEADEIEKLAKSIKEKMRDGE